VTDAPPDFKGSRILLVEDNAINQQVAAEFLKRFNMTVILANNGVEAVEWASRENFDAVFMDLHMPVMDGLEATRRIRELPNRRNLPIIAMTAAVMPEDRERCAACGMVDFVSKPIDPDELTQVLRHWIKPRGEGANAVGYATPGNASLPAFLPGYDLDQALKRLGGNRDLLVRLLRSFVKEHAGTLAQLDALLETGDNANALGLLHTLKGVASNLGASELARWSQQLEQEIRAGVPLYSLSSFAGALTVAMDGLSTQVPPDKGKPSPEHLDTKALADLLRGMAPYLREREVISDEQSRTLCRLAQNDWPDAPLAKLIHQIDQFDYAGALATIAQLAATLGLESFA